MTALTGLNEGRRMPAAVAGRPAMLALFGAIAALQLTNVFHREVNWDEFHFLSLIFEYQSGNLHGTLQTFHVHLFSWLTSLPTDEMGMTVTGRALMWLLHIATLWFLYRLAGQLVPGQGALWAVSAYATILYVTQHATSFRTDPVITALLMGALFALARERPSLAALTLASLAVALAGLISIKSVFYVPIIAALACLRLARSTEKARLFRDMAIALVIAGAAFAGALAWHSAMLGQSGAAAAVDGVAGASAKQFLDRELFHGGSYFVRSLMGSPLQWATILMGMLVAMGAAIRAKGVERLHALTLLTFASPLLLVVFYRNSFPYFYVFMLAPVAILAAFSLEAHRMLRRRAWQIPVVFVALAAVQAITQWQRDNEGQNALVSAVHELFPEPVPYIDRAGMIASFPRAGFFMSTWGIEGYRLRGEPIISRTIEQMKPPLVIVSGYPLTAALEPGVPQMPEYALLPKDAVALRENYIRHWGPLWVAGKQLPSSGGAPNAFNVAVPGDYTVESDGTLKIDGQVVRPGEIVMLEVGEHVHAGGSAVLRYGRNLPVPAGEPPAYVFSGF